MNNCLWFWALGTLTGVLLVLVGIGLVIKRNLDKLVRIASPLSDREE